MWAVPSGSRQIKGGPGETLGFCLLALRFCCGVHLPWLQIHHWPLPLLLRSFAHLEPSSFRLLPGPEEQQPSRDPTGFQHQRGTIYWVPSLAG